MLNVHASLEATYAEKGYVTIGRDTGRVDMVHGPSTCLVRIRDGACLMSPGHRGRHSTVVFYCDGCGKTRRGTPHTSGFDTDGVLDVVFCFLCSSAQITRRSAPGRYGY